MVCVADPDRVPEADMVFGICLGSATEAKLDASPDHGLSVFQRIASAGFTSVRIDAGYTTKVLGTDPCIRAAFKAGLDVLLILDAYKPSIGVAAFSAFAGGVAKTYSPLGVKRYEVTNEPNGYLGAAEYVPVLQGAYEAVKKVSTSNFVISGGLQPYGSYPQTSGTIVNPVLYLQQMYAAGAKGHMDAVGIHPYSFPALPSCLEAWNAWRQMNGTSPSLRSVMAASGDGVLPLWLTEFGAPSNPYQVQFQGQSVVSAFGSLASYMGALYLFTWQDTPGGDGWFGMNDPEGNPKLSLFASQRGLLQ